MKKILVVLMVLMLASCGEKKSSGKPHIDNNNTSKNEDTMVQRVDSFILDDFKDGDNKVRIAFVGDSITYGFGTDDPSNQSYPSLLNEMFNGRYIIGNFGKNSAYVLDAESPLNVKIDQKDRSIHNTEEYKKSFEFKPNVVVIMLGFNDIRSIMTDFNAKDEFVESLAALCEEYLNYEGVKKVYIATCNRCHTDNGVSYISNGDIQQYQKEAAEKAGVEVIDIYERCKDDFEDISYYTSDRIHFNVKGQEVIANAFYDFFKKSS